jgi:ABC-type branched-subunit amino acid transport system substrate-binding protein
MLFADAVRRAVRPDRESVVRALASTRDFQGAAGTITFDDRGDPRSKEVCILRFEAHQSVFIKAIAP